MIEALAAWAEQVHLSGQTKDCQTIPRARIARGKGAFIMHRRSVRAAGIMLTAVVVTVGIGARVRAQRGQVPRQGRSSAPPGGCSSRRLLAD